MNISETDLQKFEEDLQLSKKKLNDLMCDYQDKIHSVEKELQYLNDQLQHLKRMSSEAENAQPEAVPARPAALEMQPPQTEKRPQITENLIPQPDLSLTDSQKPLRKPQEYEKMFGKNFMGIFASGLIFVSLVIFATLIVPYLNDTMKLLGLYILSFGILGAGLLLFHKHSENKFYIALIGCGTGSLYLSLLLSDLYFKVIDDTVLYCLILVWAVLVKRLTKLKNLVFQVIGHVGIFIATCLGTVLCVTESDAQKFFILTVFYLLSACIFSDMGKEELRLLLWGRKDGASDLNTRELLCYERRLLNHISKTLNASVFLLGFGFLEPGGFQTAGILLLVTSLLLEYFVAYREVCRKGFSFQLLSIVNALLLIGFFHATQIFAEDATYVFMYLVAIALLFYAEKKGARFRLLTQICCLYLAVVGCTNNLWIKKHLYAYLTVIPCLLYGQWKNKKFYLNAGAVCLSPLWIFLLTYEFRGYGSIEYVVMMAAVYASFLYAGRNRENNGFKVFGYLLLTLAVLIFTSNMAYDLMSDYNRAYSHEVNDISSKSGLITFFVISLIHLALNKLDYLGRAKSVDKMMLAVNAVLMFAGCIYMNDMPWQLPTILITVLLFVVNSTKLLPRHKYMGYYIVFKYTVLLFCILNSFHVVNYAISISLLVFAIVCIMVGFYRDNISFRLYGLVLSMISVIKLILIDLNYDSTLENALSFFACGVLCFVISFIYHKIDVGLKKK